MMCIDKEGGEGSINKIKSSREEDYISRNNGNNVIIGSNTGGRIKILRQLVRLLLMQKIQISLKGLYYNDA